MQPVGGMQPLLLPGLLRSPPPHGPPLHQLLDIADKHQPPTPASGGETSNNKKRRSSSCLVPLPIIARSPSGEIIEESILWDVGGAGGDTDHLVAPFIESFCREHGLHEGMRQRLKQTFTQRVTDARAMNDRFWALIDAVWRKELPPGSYPLDGPVVKIEVEVPLPEKNLSVEDRFRWNLCNDDNAVRLHVASLVTDMDLPDEMTTPLFAAIKKQIHDKRVEHVSLHHDPRAALTANNGNAPPPPKRLRTIVPPEFFGALGDPSRRRGRGEPPPPAKPTITTIVTDSDNQRDDTQGEQPPFPGPAQTTFQQRAGSSAPTPPLQQLYAPPPPPPLPLRLRAASASVPPTVAKGGTVAFRWIDQWKKAEMEWGPIVSRHEPQGAEGDPLQLTSAAARRAAKSRRFTRSALAQK
ncbi:unnamed protein product [Vitrella brassicaformis CCMP3155]|uniref:Uncharacterized protein n=1 Tax=Vitrella brassicaformis (strain CCMP3155) TaxID=1169540 RepID=A0A0G4EAC7_VITBC|nr:unnamed protein product [Vitrella brassicaformis CCMP3155]|mmetsp:Transcript_27388/g.78833  ORF Transcript_27388/g.78833 Transcript_27388/m.78833 type:complete len:411 (+) Transcript_27388:227-1459(+)|eukprot:CEL92553.1 unnamed protein product [Vitrella brassicaformis CCMP3155]